jgi:isopentenyl-diphosphate Delta-isomerase
MKTDNMDNSATSTSDRKKDHLEICSTDDAAFKVKSSGFDNYDFIHNAVTEVEYDKISLESTFFNKSISFPFIISCMTGGTIEAESINSRLAEVAEELNIPIGVGSQRQALENNDYLNSYKIIREKAPNVPVLGNIGAAQFIKFKHPDELIKLADIIKADAMVIHLNAAQELLQREGEPAFKGLFKQLKIFSGKIDIPVIIKEVGAGIEKNAALRMLRAGASGIDVAGAGGTSWTKVEMIRNNQENNDFGEWGNPVSYCIRTVAELKKRRSFLLIGSGGISNGFDIAKALALGADLTASARIILQELNKNGNESVVKLIKDWFNTVRKIMYLTGASELNELNRNVIIKKREFF